MMLNTASREPHQQLVMSFMFAFFEQLVWICGMQRITDFEKKNSTWTLQVGLNGFMFVLVATWSNIKLALLYEWMQWIT